MYTNSELDGMTKEELVSYANLTFGLGVSKAFRKQDIISQIEQAQRKYKGNKDIEVLKDGDERRVPKGHVKIRVRPGKYDRVPRPVIIGHNFKMMSVPVNRDVILPAKYLPCFTDAVQSTYFQDPETLEFTETQELTHSISILEKGEGVA